MAVESDATIRPFEVDFGEGAIDDLRRRVRATRWPDRETVADDSQGVQLATIQQLASYWGSGYDFGRLEAQLSSLPQYRPCVDDADEAPGLHPVRGAGRRLGERGL